jgi:hypothetical protein
MPPFALQKVKKVPEIFFLNNNNKMKKIPHPLPPARVKNGNKSLTHNTKNNKKGEK